MGDGQVKTESPSRRRSVPGPGVQPGSRWGKEVGVSGREEEIGGKGSVGRRSSDVARG